MKTTDKATTLDLNCSREAGFGGRGLRWRPKRSHVLLASGIAICAVVLFPLSLRAARARTNEMKPPDRLTFLKERKLARKGHRMVNGILGCHRQAIVGFSQDPYHYNSSKLGQCLDPVKSKWVTAASGLLGDLGHALSNTDGDPAKTFDLLDLELRRTYVEEYCCGKLRFTMENFTGYVPDPSYVDPPDNTCTLKRVNRTVKAEQKLAGALLACHIKFLKASLNSTPFLLATCEADAKGAFSKRIAKIGGLPACIKPVPAPTTQEISPSQETSDTAGLANELSALFQSQAGQVASEGDSYVDPSGCCDDFSGESVTCSNVPDATSCNGGNQFFVQGTECNTATNWCRPVTCPYPWACNPREGLEGAFTGDTILNCPENCYCGNDTCDLGEDAVSCYDDCHCGNGVCEPAVGEDYSTCPADCYCGNGTCDAGENTEGCYQDCHCGNGNCDSWVGEDASTCSVDCYCGNGTCDAGESPSSCLADCIPPTCTGDCQPGGQQEYCCQNNCCQSDADCNIYEAYPNCNTSTSPVGCCAGGPPGNR